MVAKKRTSSTVTSEESTSAGKVAHVEEEDRAVGGNPSKSFKKAAYAAKCVKPESNKPRIIKNLKQVSSRERVLGGGGRKKYFLINSNEYLNVFFFC